MEEYDLIIDEFGCQVIHVLGENELPPFSYSIGINRKQNKPEILVIGLKQEIAHFIVNEYCKRVKDEEFLMGNDGLYSGFLDGFKVRFSSVLKKYYNEYLGQCQRYYKSDDFEVIQLVYPNTKGIWPDSDQSNSWFKNWQPILSI